MEIVCKACKKPFNAHPGEIASAAIDYTFGRKHTFICDNCKAENILTKAEYEAIKDALKTAPTPVAVAPKPVAKPVAVTLQAGCRCAQAQAGCRIQANCRSQAGCRRTR